jgi:hypothetical protein
MIEFKDIVMIVLCVGLLVVAMLPAEERGPVDTDADAGLFSDRGEKSVAKAQAPEDDVAGQGTETAGVASPVLDVPHHYLPLVPGSEWLYRVRGPEHYVKAKTWTMKLLEAPQADEPGEIEVGYDDKRESFPVWLDNQSVRFGFLPFVEPIEFLHDRPETILGELLPAKERILEGAVWLQEYEREVEYRYLDKQRKWQTTLASGYQRDRANVKEFRNVTVPAGVFRACRVDWLSRLELKAEGRPVLKELTTEPFRRERMWIVPGIGVVKRTVEYPGHRAAQFIFDLVSYTRPGAELTK